MKIWEFDIDTFGSTVRELRYDKHLSQTELASKTEDVSIACVRNYEQDVSLPTVHQLINLAHALGIDEVRIDTSKARHRRII